MEEQVYHNGYMMSRDCQAYVKKLEAICDRLNRQTGWLAYEIFNISKKSEERICPPDHQEGIDCKGRPCYQCWEDAAFQASLPEWEE